MGWGTSLIEGAKSLTGMDISKEAIQEANERYSDHAKFELGDMTNLGLRGECIDVVSCLEGIEHVPQEVGLRFLKECHRILRPGGLLLLSSPYCRTSSHSGNPYHLHEYQPDEIRDIVAVDFEIEDTVARDVDIMTVLYLKCRRKK
jgi:2-polyprenyl-3-methyl-5-hydroxy-6-metoxy-1,4-benzoquinol methylase